MIRPEPQVIKSMAMAVRQYPEVTQWLEGVLANEMKRLPYVAENSAVCQGRCQILIELLEFAKEFPAMAAKL
jgi:hypothetical protein